MVDEILEPPFCSHRLFLLMSPATISWGADTGSITGQILIMGLFLLPGVSWLEGGGLTQLTFGREERGVILCVYQDSMAFSLNPEATLYFGYPRFAFLKNTPSLPSPTPIMANFPFSAFPVWPAWGGLLPGRRVSWKQTDSAPLLSPNESWYWLRPCWAALWRAGGTVWEFGLQTVEETEPQDNHHGRH